MPLDVELFFSPYCPYCHAARAHVQATISELPATAVSYQERNVIEHLERAVDLGVKATPALAISGKLMPAVRWEKQTLRVLLNSQMQKEGDHGSTDR